MARITGSQTKSIYVLGETTDTYGVANAASTGDKIRGNIATAYAVQELIKNPIGGGLNMQDDIIAGRLTPAVTISGDLGFQTGTDKIAAQFFGASTAPAEQTATEADYMHRLTLNPTTNNVYGTFAYELTSDKVAELPSVACRTFTTSFTQTTELVQFSAELLGNDLILDTSVNTNAVIAAATASDTECVIVKFEDSFWINEEAGAALDSGDQLNILSYTRTLTRPQDFSGLVKGSAGNPEPLADSLITGTLAVTLESLDDITFYEAWLAGTTYKCKLDVQGSQINDGDNKTWAEYCPRMKLVQPPQYTITESGFNSVSLTFVLLEATANPTGMNSVRPYVEVTNGRSTAYIA